MAQQEITPHTCCAISPQISIAPTLTLGALEEKEFFMKSRLALLLVVFAALLAPSAHAQWAVFDSTNYANAIREYRELQNMYTTAVDTRNQVIAAYNSADGKSITDATCRSRKLKNDLTIPEGFQLESTGALKLTAQDLLKLGVIDGVVPEPLGGAHRGAADTIAALGDALDAVLQPLLALDGAALVTQRKRKFIEMGAHGL